MFNLKSIKSRMKYQNARNEIFKSNNLDIGAFPSLEREVYEQN